ncbi:hypothetical protein [Shewanella woodyi]|uniref:hypothetical protein n=1 Tax=Shewanella woodyi TaxID=60961 RepID=UPI0012F99C93|nr:hypothetical protein [Shewanella woodyi]
MKVSILGRFCSIGAFSGAGSLLTSVFVFLPIAYFTDIEALDTLTLTLLFSGVGFCLLHYALSLLVRCPSCHKILMFSWSKHTHQNSPCGNGTEVAFHWFKGKVVCIHCGETLNINGT